MILQKLREGVKPMSRQEVAALETDVRACEDLAARAMEGGHLILWFLICVHLNGWAFRVRLERWRATR